MSFGLDMKQDSLNIPQLLWQFSKWTCSLIYILQFMVILFYPTLSLNCLISLYFVNTIKMGGQVCLITLQRRYTESEDSIYVKINCKKGRSGQHEKVPGKKLIQSHGNFLNRGNTVADAFLVLVQSFTASGKGDDKGTWKLIIIIQSYHGRWSTFDKL